MTQSERTYWTALGARIRAARKAAGMTQLDLGLALGRACRGRGSSVAIHYYETGRNRIDAYTLRQIERVLGAELYA